MGKVYYFYVECSVLKVNVMRNKILIGVSSYVSSASGELNIF